MDLLKYLEPMKNLPNRFSNLAFWRGVGKLKDDIVNAFEYVDSWGKNIENEIAISGIKIIKTDALNNNMVTFNPHNNSYFVDIKLNNSINAPTNAKLAIINLHLQAKVSDRTYTYECRGTTPIVNSQIIYKFYRAICTETMPIDSPTYTLVDSSIWYFG